MEISYLPYLHWIENKEGNGSCLEESQKLLLRGNREEAVKCALSGGDHALALLIASMCGPSTFHTTARYFIDKTLKSGTPLHTATGLYANQMQSPEEVEGEAIEFWTGRTESLNETWQYHLATILSNQTRGWKKVVTALGDELLYAGNTSAAHFCYLVCGRPITQHTDPSSRLVLLGCDHRIKNQIALMTNDSREAYLRTEAYEWAKRKGNPNAVITTLQPFKLRYATLLADYGFEEMAKSYLDSIRKCTGLYPCASDKAGKSRSAHIYSSDFLESLDVFEDRLCVSLGVPNENAVNKQTKMFGLSSVLSKIVPKSMSSKSVDSFSDPVSADASFDDADYQEHDDTHMSFVSASSNLLDTTINTLSTAKTSHSTFVKSSGCGQHAPPMSTVQESLPQEKQETPKASPSIFMQTPVKDTSMPDSVPKPAFMPSPYMLKLNGNETPKPLDNKPLRPSYVATPTKTLDSKQVIDEAPKSAPLASAPSVTSTPVDRKPRNEAPSSASSKLFHFLLQLIPFFIISF